LPYAEPSGYYVIFGFDGITCHFPGYTPTYR
jgi:hypothetical protein